MLTWGLLSRAVIDDVCACRYRGDVKKRVASESVGRPMCTGTDGACVVSYNMVLDAAQALVA